MVLGCTGCAHARYAYYGQLPRAQRMLLLEYQTLIVEARMEYEGDGWLGYDRRFRQNAAASSDICWSKIDPTLWNKAFAGQAKASRCKHCFSLTHSAEECDWAPTPSANKAPVTNRYVSAPRARPAKVCYEWNHNPSPTSPFPGCRYQHICWYCSSDPQVTDKEHKAMHCPRRRRRRSRPPVQPAGNFQGYQRFRPY